MLETSALGVEIARLRNLDLSELRARWHTTSGRKAPGHLPRHVLIRIPAYRLQADRLGDLDKDTQRLLDRITGLRKQGYNVQLDRPDRERGCVYRIAPTYARAIAS